MSSRVIESPAHRTSWLSHNTMQITEICSPIVPLLCFQRFYSLSLKKISSLYWIVVTMMFFIDKNSIEVSKIVTFSLIPQVIRLEQRRTFSNKVIPYIHLSMVWQHCFVSALTPPLGCKSSSKSSKVITFLAVPQILARKLRFL